MLGFSDAVSPNCKKEFENINAMNSISCNVTEYGARSKRVQDIRKNKELKQGDTLIIDSSYNHNQARNNERRDEDHIAANRNNANHNNTMDNGLNYHRNNTVICSASQQKEISINSNTPEKK